MNPGNCPAGWPWVRIQQQNLNVRLDRETYMDCKRCVLWIIDEQIWIIGAFVGIVGEFPDIAVVFLDAFTGIIGASLMIIGAFVGMIGACFSDHRF